MKALNYIFIPLLIIVLFCCSVSEKDEFPRLPSKYSGQDLINQLTPKERILLGKWYFAYRTELLENGTTLTSSNSLTGYANPNQRDSLTFYSTAFVPIPYGYGCLYDPPSLQNKLMKLIEPRCPYWFNYCFPHGYGGWLVENDTLIYYRGYSDNDILKYQIVELNNDSLIFKFNNSVGNPQDVIERTAVFYKDLAYSR